MLNFFDSVTTTTTQLLSVTKPFLPQILVVIHLLDVPQATKNSVTVTQTQLFLRSRYLIWSNLYQVFFGALGKIYHFRLA